MAPHLKGVTYRGGPETRGAKKKLGPRAISALDRKRKELADKDGPVLRLLAGM